MTRPSWTRCASALSSSSTARWSATRCGACTGRLTSRATLPTAYARRARPHTTTQGWDKASMRSNFVFQEIWVGLRRNLTMTVALIVVVAISLSLLGTGLLFVKQVNSTRTYWQSKVEISVYLCTASSANTACHGAVTPQQQAQLQQTLTSMPQVQHVTYVSQQQAYSLFKQDFANDQSYVSTVKETDMPPSFEVKLHNPEADYNIVASAVTGAPGVDSVIDEMTILSKFYRLLDGARNAVVIV